jgi:hypothetical protein
MDMAINNFDNSGQEIETSNEDFSSNREDSCLINIGEHEENIQIENLVPDQELAVVTQDALNTVIKYHLDGEGHSSLTKEVFKQSGLFAIAIFGVMFYYVPAKAYAEAICIDPAYKDIPCGFFVINHLMGTMLVAGGILMNATNAFFDQQKAEYIPLKLIEYLKHPLSQKQKVAGDIGTFTGSFIASIPFMIITCVNPIPGLPKILIISQAFIVGVTNTLLHLLPFKLALKNPLYRAPFLPIEFIFQATSNLLFSREAKQEKELQAQINQNYQMIKQRLINHLDLAQRLLSIYGFSFAGCRYTNGVKNDIRNIKELNQSPLQLLTQLLDRLHQMSPDRTISPPGRVNNFFRKMVYFPGASWVILACAGFWGGTFNEMTELTGSTVPGAVISAPSIYCLGVLLAFFGGNALQNSYDYLTAWKDDAVKIPMAFKLYPKTSVLLILISMYLSAFSYAAGAQLINDNFNGKLEFLRPYLLDLAKTGLIFLGFTAMIDFFNNVLSKFAQYGGAEDAQTVARLVEALSQMKDSIQLMKPNLLLDSLAQANKDQLMSNLNIKDKKDHQNISKILIQLAEKLKIKLLKESESIDKENVDEAAELSKLLYHLSNDEDYSVEKIEALLIYFDTEPELNLSLNLKKVCQEYKAVCELMKKLGSVSLVRELDTFSHINNDDNLAGPSSETTPLLLRSTGGSIHSNFFHPRLPHCYYDDRASSLSPVPTDLLRSSQMEM